MTEARDDADILTALARVYQGVVQGAMVVRSAPLSLTMFLAAPVAYLVLADDLSPDWPQQLMLLTGGAHVLALVRQLREDRRQHLIITPDLVQGELIRAAQDPSVQEELRNLGRQVERRRSEAYCDDALIQDELRKLRQELQTEREAHGQQIEDLSAKIAALKPPSRSKAITLVAFGVMLFQAVAGNEATKVVDGGAGAIDDQLKRLHRLPSHPLSKGASSSPTSSHPAVSGRPDGLDRRSNTNRERVGTMTYKPGETVPRDGTVQCTQHPETRDRVKKGTTFAPCDHWGEHGRKDCTWRYID